MRSINIPQIIDPRYQQRLQNRTCTTPLRSISPQINRQLNNQLMRTPSNSNYKPEQQMRNPTVQSHFLQFNQFQNQQQQQIKKHNTVFNTSPRQQKPSTTSRANVFQNFEQNIPVQQNLNSVFQSLPQNPPVSNFGSINSSQKQSKLECSFTQQQMIQNGNQQKSNLIEQELALLKKVLKSQEQECQMWKNKYEQEIVQMDSISNSNELVSTNQKLINQLNMKNKEINELQNQLNAYIQEKQKLSDEIKLFQESSQKFEHQKQELNTKCKQLDDQIKYFQSHKENYASQKILVESLQQEQQLKQIDQNIGPKNQKQDDEIRRLKDLLAQQINKTVSWKVKAKQAQEQNDNQENQEIQNIIIQKNDEILHWKNKYQLMQEVLQKYNQISEGLNQYENISNINSNNNSAQFNLNE